MEILVNEKLLDFDIESEIGLNQVLDKIASWAEKEKHYILDYKVFPEDADPDTLNSSNINRLEVNIGDQQELVTDNLYEIVKYLDKVGIFIADSLQNEKDIDQKSAVEIKEGMSWVTDGFESIMKQLGTETDKNMVEVIEYFRHHEYARFSMEFLENMAEINNKASFWSNQLTLSQMSDEELKEMKKKYINNFNNTLEDLEKIATNLTVGKESEAIIELEKTVTFLGDAAAVFSKIDGSTDLSEKLLSVLNDLTSALDKSDMVTAADIVDFDLKEILEKFSAA